MSLISTEMCLLSSLQEKIDSKEEYKFWQVDPTVHDIVDS